MGKKVLLKNKSFAPFLGSRLSIIRGLDPLGLQNASVRTYSLLLPGLNNVTDRVRYYSFYCWLLGAYAKHNGSTAVKEQRRFVRQGEYLVALLSCLVDQSKTGIPGSDYADKKLKAEEIEVYDLREGIYKPDGSTEDTYWKAPFGAFGQYYQGALKQIGLIGNQQDHSKLYVRTPQREELQVSGEALQEAFAENVPVAERQLFIDILQKGEVSRAELKRLLPAFDLTQVPAGSREQQLLLQLFMGQDYPTKLEEDGSNMRQQTIRLLLSFVEADAIDLSDRSFPVQAYDKKGHFNGQEDDCLTAWYFYQFNEYWQVACTAILNGVLGYLMNQSPVRRMPLLMLIEQSAEAILVELNKELAWLTSESRVEDIIDQADQIEEEWKLYEGLRGTGDQQRMANGFLLLWKLYASNRPHLMRLKNFVINKGVTSDQDAVTFFTSKHWLPQETCLDFLKSFLHKHIIRRHQLVALRKLGSGTQSTQKFIIEEGYIKYLGNFVPTFTGPRLRNLISFLRDLQVFDDQDQITDDGLALLN